jgi:hypothetical protein
MTRHSKRIAFLLALLTIAWPLLVASVAQEQASKEPVFIAVDHASFCGSNLDSMRQAFASVGLTSDYGGPHSNGVTHMALLGFSNGSYLELIAPQNAALVEGSAWAKLMAGNAGPCAWAVEPDDIQQEAARLKRAGIAVTGPQPGSRKRPDGMSVEWQIADLGSGTPGSMLPFLIQDRTPRAWRVQPSPSLANSPLTGIAAVVLGVNDLNATSALFQRAFQWAPPITEEHKDFDAKLAYFPGTPVILAAPLNGHSWLSDRLQKFGGGPVAYFLITQNFNAAQKEYHLSGAKTWFGQRVAWFDEHRLNGWRLGVLGQ